MMKRSLLLVFALILTLGCSEDKKKAPAGGVQPPPQETPDEKAKKLKDLPVEQALQTKYSRLEFVCDVNADVTRPEGEKGRRSYTLSERAFVWDILNDYTRERWFDFPFDFENVESTFQFKVILQLEDLITSKRLPTGEQVAVRLRNAIAANGEIQLRIVESMENSSGLALSRGPEARSFYDRIPSELILISFGPKNDSRTHTRLKVECEIEAEVRSGYEDDYKVVVD